MRKSFVILLVLISMLTACSKDTKRVSLNAIPNDYSIDDAKSDDCVVYEDGDITDGQSLWDDFIKATEKDESATIRLAFYYTLGDPSNYTKEYYEEIKDDYPELYIKDLSYDGEKFTIESIEDGNLISKEYKYMMKYEGQPSSATALFSDYMYYVLVDDNSVTWNDIEHGMFSSQLGDWIEHSVVYSDLVWK